MNDPSFHPTQWTLVLNARGDGAQAKAALSDLCAAYYAPVVAFLRSEGRSEDAAREMAHSFFEKILIEGVGSPEPPRGRFRSYLLGALKHFLAKQRAASLAGKRGGGAEHVPLVDDSGAPDDTLAFDRDWAMNLIGRALSALEAENTGKVEVFTTLKPWLDGGAACSQAEAAHLLGMSETAVKVAIHRLRARFRELIRAEVAATVNDPGEVAEELRHLISVASRG
jgi:RNA polymerase sigma-70 factor (ECF subfamily)